MSSTSSMSDIPMIIALSGKIGVGKDYIAQNIVVPYLTEKGNRVHIMSFADQIKVNVSSKHGIPLRELYGTKTAENRLRLQKEGQDAKGEYGNAVWVNYVHNWCRVRKMNNDCDVVLIPDCRFKVEADWLQANGGYIFRIEAPDRNRERLLAEANGSEEIYNKISSHASEVGLDDYGCFDYTIDNTKQNHSTVTEDTVACLQELFNVR